MCPQMKYVKNNGRLLVYIFKGVDTAVDNDVDSFGFSLFEAGLDQIAQIMGNNNLINFNYIQNST
jgi:hypothetical protein